MLSKTYSNSRHQSSFLQQWLSVSTDVEKNPGPRDAVRVGDNGNSKAPLMVTSYNVRGLNDSTKTRHLINHLYKLNKGKTMDFIAGLQETFITNGNSLSYLWRGNLFVTPGNGNSCGCVTFLSSHLNVIASRNLGDRAHAIVCQRTGENKAAYIIANLYAPNPNTNAKIEFYENVFETVNELEEQFDCSNVLVLGDFNLTFGLDEMKNRNYTSQERRVAAAVKNLIESKNLKDIWKEKKYNTRVVT